MSSTPEPGPLRPTGRIPHATSRRLPPYRGLLAVDAKDFTGYPAIQHGEISRAIPQILQLSFQRAELSEVWDDRRFPDSTGDGYVFGFDPAAMPFVIHPWLNTLQEVLTEFNAHSAGTVRIRLRASLHIGPLPDSGAEFDGNGTPRNDTHRLLDSRPVKAVLASSNENVTQVAAILSDRCYQDAVASGYTGRHTDHFIEVPATVEGKRFDQRAWLYVPSPSGNLRDARVLGDGVAEEPVRQDAERRREVDPARPPVTVHHSRADRGFVNHGKVDGGQSVTNVEGGGQYIAGNSIGGDYVGGNKGDVVHGDKHSTEGTR